MFDEGFSGRPQSGSSRNRPHGNLNILRIAIVLMFSGAAPFQIQIVDGVMRTSRETTSFSRTSSHEGILDRTAHSLVRTLVSTPPPSRPGDARG
jgi:hypothetical protein